MIVAVLATDLRPVKGLADIEPTLKNQLIWSTVLVTPAIWLVSMWALPSSFDHVFVWDLERKVHDWQLFVCVASGLWGGLLIGVFTDLMTSSRFRPVQQLAEAATSGAATEIIFGLALGYKSCIVPALSLATIICVSFFLAGMLGIACAALGMLSTLCVALTIDNFGPISDNAGGRYLLPLFRAAAALHPS